MAADDIASAARDIANNQVLSPWSDPMARQITQSAIDLWRSGDRIVVDIQALVATTEVGAPIEVDQFACAAMPWRFGALFCWRSAEDDTTLLLLGQRDKADGEVGVHFVLFLSSGEGVVDVGVSTRFRLDGDMVPIGRQYYIAAGAEAMGEEIIYRAKGIGWQGLSALDFLNCSNVDIVEPQRERHLRKRIAKTGVRVHELVVTRPGQRTRSQGGTGEGAVPLHSVRGHFSHYGPKYGKGLLFGKYEGRFWIPQHARGDAKWGEDHHDYKLVPDA